MQAAGTLNNVNSGAEVQVVSVAQDDAGMNVIVKVADVNSFYVGHGPDRHENRRLHLTVGRFQLTRAGIRLSVSMLNYKPHDVYK